MVLRIFKHSEFFSKGLEDRFNSKMGRSLNEAGIPCVVRDMWPDLAARALLPSKIPSTKTLFSKGIRYLVESIHLLRIKENDVVWAGPPPIPERKCYFELEVIKKGASYVFWMEDDLLSDAHFAEAARARIEIAHLIVAVTPFLKERVFQEYPGKKVLVLEEPIDVDRLIPVPSRKDNHLPSIIWSGRPWNLNSLSRLDPVLRKVYSDIPFELKVITGVTRPVIDLSIPWKWFAYDRSREAEYASGAVAGLAPLEDSTYNRSKGNYKVKTYMALGVPPLTSPVGYNNVLIRHGETGYLLESESQWDQALRKLVEDKELAARIGSSAREEAVKRYSYSALAPIWADALEKSFPDQLRRQSACHPEQHPIFTGKETLYRQPD